MPISSKKPRFIKFTPQVTTAGRRSEIKTIKVNCCTNYDNGVYLRWKNSVGGVDYMLFDKRVADEFQAATTNSYEKPLQDLYTGDKMQVVGKESRLSLICYKTFKRINLAGYRALCASKLVQMWDGVNWHNVDIELVQLENVNVNPECKIVIKVIKASNER